MNAIKLLRLSTQVTQKELAQRAGTSQPTIAAYEAGHKSPSLRTLRRMASSVGRELIVTYVPPLTREDRRSIALHTAIARRLVADPGPVIAQAELNLALMRAKHPHARRLFDLWTSVLRLPVPELSDLLVDPRPWVRELRQVTPFAGVLTPQERWDTYRSFAQSENAA